LRLFHVIVARRCLRRNSHTITAPASSQDFNRLEHLGEAARSLHYPQTRHERAAGSGNGGINESTWAEQFWNLDGIRERQSRRAMRGDGSRRPPTGWNNVFTDDMMPGGEGNWNYTSGGSQVNGEHECYHPANVFRTSDGYMHIKTELMLNDAYCGGQDIWDWRSGEAQGKYNMTGGSGSSNSWMMESRLRIPNGNGYWPAFWAVSTGCDMLHDCPVWPPEYDIMEVMFHNVNLNKSTTWTGPHGGQSGHTIDMPGLPDLSADFHTYTGFWFSNYANTLFDGQRKAEWWNGDVPTGTQKLIFNTAVGANGADSNPSWSNATAYMDIDYARIWQLGSLDGGKRYRVAPSVTSNQWNVSWGLAAQHNIIVWNNAYGVGDTNLDFQITWMGGDEYVIKTWNGPNGGYCLDSLGGGQGTGIQTWDCNNGTNQRWYMYDAGAGHVQIKAKSNSALCLDTSGGGAAGSNIQLYPCSGNDFQRFRFMQN
jgi:hypothetical protein